VREFVACYIRISQPDENPENQRMVLEKWCRERGFLPLFFTETVTGAENPLERPVFKQMIEFCRMNKIRKIVMLDVARLSRRYEHLKEVYKWLLREGFDVVFVNNPIPSIAELKSKLLEQIKIPEDNPVAKSLTKALVDIFCSLLDVVGEIAFSLAGAQAEAYREEVVYRTKLALDRLRGEGKLYHRPSLIDYLALHLSGKLDFKQLTKEDIEKAREWLKKFVKPYLEVNVPKKQIAKLLREYLEREGFYMKFPKAPKSIHRIIDNINKVIS